MSKTLLRISGIITLIIGIIYSLTIVLLIIGIPTIVGAVKLLNCAEMETSELNQNKNTILIWGIVLLFLCFVAGVLALIAYSQINSDSKKVIEEPKKEVTKKSTNSPKKEVEKKDTASSKKTTNTSKKEGAKKTTKKTSDGKTSTTKTSSKKNTKTTKQS